MASFSNNDEAASSKYGTMTLPQLRLELKKKGAKLSGRKKDLIDRLTAYDRNFNFGKNQSVDDLAEYRMETPPEQMYRDLHSGSKFPDFSMENIEAYLEPLHKKLGQESVNMVSEKFLLFVKTASDQDINYVKSQCKAEMKKSVKYNIDVSIDSLGQVAECQCDCGSGMGPEAHCKHVNALLYALFKFSLSGTIIVENTCTQKLQTFHHVKQHKGSPVKACNIATGVKRKDNVSDKRQVNYDPRPQKYRKMAGYPDSFRNTCLNYRYIYKVPFSQLYSPANTYAVANDHDYLRLSPEDMFLKHVGHFDVTTDHIEEMERKTRGQSSSKEWIEMRCLRINSSMFGRVCKLTDKTDLKKFASSLTIHTDIQSAALKHGRKFEHVAIKKFSEKTKLAVNKCGSCICKEIPYVAASPDGLIGDDATIEVKCPFVSKDKPISTRTVPYLVTDQSGNLTLKKSHDYYYQVQGQLLCTNRKRCYFCIYTSVDFKVIEIVRDVDFIDEMTGRLKLAYRQYFRQAVLDRFFFKDYTKYTF